MKLKEKIAAFFWGRCDICGKPLSEKFDNKSKDLCYRHEVESLLMYLTPKIEKIVIEYIEEISKMKEEDVEEALKQSNVPDVPITNTPELNNLESEKIVVQEENVYCSICGNMINGQECSICNRDKEDKNETAV